MLKNEDLAERRMWRTAVQIEKRNDSLVDVLIPGWNPNTKVTLPVEYIEPGLRDLAVPGRVFFALVNIGAARSEDLVFGDFELAPEPIDLDNEG